MAHYAFINDANIVTEVIVGRDEDDLVDGISSWEDYYASKREGMICKRTSYNTFIDESGVPQHNGDGTPFRGCYAAIGYSYDATADVFIPQGLTYDQANGIFIRPPINGDE